MDAILARRTVVRQARHNVRMRLIAAVRIVPMMNVSMMVRVLAMRGNMRIVRRQALGRLVRAERCARAAPDDDQNRQQQLGDTPGPQPKNL
jgi:hypothetical protein